MKTEGTAQAKCTENGKEQHETPVQQGGKSFNQFLADREQLDSKQWRATNAHTGEQHGRNSRPNEKFREKRECFIPESQGRHTEDTPLFKSRVSNSAIYFVPVGDDLVRSLVAAAGQSPLQLGSELQTNVEAPPPRWVAVVTAVLGVVVARSSSARKNVLVDPERELVHDRRQKRVEHLTYRG